MVGTELRLLELQRLLEERQGQVQLPGILIRSREVVHAGERVGMVGPSFAFVSLSVSSKSGRARSSFPASPIRHGEVVHAGERVGMVGPSFAFVSFSVSSKSGRARSSFPASRYATARLLMLASVSGWSGPRFCRYRADGALQEADRPFVLSHAAIRTANRLQNLRLNQRLVREVRVDPLRRQFLAARSSSSRIVGFSLRLRRSPPARSRASAWVRVSA